MFVAWSIVVFRWCSTFCFEWSYSYQLP